MRVAPVRTRKCLRCLQELDATKFLTLRSSGQSRYRFYCKECMGMMLQEWNTSQQDTLTLENFMSSATLRHRAKICSSCKRILSVTSFWRNTAAGTEAYCKECQMVKKIDLKIRNIDKNKDIEKVLMQQKKCCTCKKIKNAPEFHLNKTNTTGLDNCCKECESVRRKADNKKIKLNVFQHYGLQCRNCNEDDLDVLNIDHINNNGAHDLTGKPFYLKLIKSGYPEGYQTLCYNCNIKKLRKDGVLPTKEFFGGDGI